MFEFRVYTPINDEIFFSGRTLSREQAWEKASFFILNDPRWMDADGVVSNVERADKNAEPMNASSIDFGHPNFQEPPVAVDIFEVNLVKAAAE